MLVYDDDDDDHDHGTDDIEPKTEHITILQARLLYAISRRDLLLEQDPYLTLVDLWPIDQDIITKKRDLDNAVEALRRERRLRVSVTRRNNGYSNQW